MEYQNYRISKLRDYLFENINTLTTNKDYQINADFLGDVNDFSLNKIPTASVVTRWISGVEVHRDVYSFRSRKFYSSDAINNLINIGFFEDFEELISSNNKKGILPDIDKIENIECLNCGTLISIDGTRATFDIQIQVTYRVDNTERKVPSL